MWCVLFQIGPIEIFNTLPSPPYFALFETPWKRMHIELMDFFGIVNEIFAVNVGQFFGKEVIEWLVSTWQFLVKQR